MYIYILYCLYMYVYINVCVHFILYYFILCFPFFVPGSADHTVKKQFRRLAEWLLYCLRAPWAGASHCLSFVTKPISSNAEYKSCQRCPWARARLHCRRGEIDALDILTKASSLKDKQRETHSHACTLTRALSHLGLLIPRSLTWTWQHRDVQRVYGLSL